MDGFANAAKCFSLTISLKKTEVMLQPRPGSTPTKQDIIVSDTQQILLSRHCFLIECRDKWWRHPPHQCSQCSIWQTGVAPLEGRWLCLTEHKSCSLHRCSHRYPAVQLRVMDHLSLLCTQSRSISHALPLLQPGLWQNKILNTQVLKRCKISGIEAKLCWVGHVYRMSDSRISKATYTELPSGIKHNCRPLLFYCISQTTWPVYCWWA